MDRVDGLAEGRGHGRPFPLPHASHDLTGQVALVTGASSGLGERFAKVLAAAGAAVVLAARRRERLETLAAAITASGGKAVGVAMDATDARDLESALESAEAAFGTVTILINNAGVPDAQRAHKMPLELVDRVIDVNLRAPWLLSCAVARRLIAAGKPGRIVNISSIAAYRYTGIGAALYATTKAAIVRMSEALAVEWARYGINVNAIAPGTFHSEMTDGYLERMGDVTAQMPRKRIGDPAQLDSTLLYLLSPASDMVTGVSIRVDDVQEHR